MIVPPRSKQKLVRIATHRKPDADAIAAAWLAKRFLFADRRCQLILVPYDFDANKPHDFDTVVDVGSVFDPDRLLFDHNRKAVSDPCGTCATLQVFEHLRDTGHPADHLEALAQLVHDGDIAARRARSAAYRASSASGLHALIRHLRQQAISDEELSKRVQRWLTRHEASW